MRPFTSIFAALAALGVAISSAEAGINVDGDLSDWGIYGPKTESPEYPDHSSMLTNNPVQLEPGVTQTLSNFHGGTLYYQMEDSGNQWYVGPNYGGLNYDMKFLGFTLDSSNLYIAIATGQRPDNYQGSHRWRYGPGDIRIQTSGEIYGIEVGGGVSSVASGAIEEGGPGTTYWMNDSGYTIYARDSVGNTWNTWPNQPPPDAHRSDQTAGSVWLTDPVKDWLDDPIPPPGPTQVYIGPKSQINAKDAECKGLADFVYNFSADLGELAFIEVSVPLSYFGGAQVYGVGCAPACGNDALEAFVPEPASLIVWFLLGGLGIAGAWWRKRRTAA